MVCLRKQRMIAGKHFGETNYIIIALAHLLAIDGNHVIVYPVTGRHFMITDHTLGDFTFVVRKHKVHTPAMNIKPRSQIFCAHC